MGILSYASTISARPDVTVATYSAYPNASRLNVQVHQVVNYSTLKIVLYPVDDDLTAHIDDLAVCHVRLILIHRLVHPLIHRDTLSEILCRLLRILPLVIRRRKLHVFDVGHDQLLIVAFGFYEQRLDSLGIAAVL